MEGLCLVNELGFAIAPKFVEQWRVANADLLKGRMPPDRRQSAGRGGRSVRSDGERGIIGFLQREGGSSSFHGRAVRANDRRRGDLTFLKAEEEEECSNNPSRFGNANHLRSLGLSGAGHGVVTNKRSPSGLFKSIQQSEKRWELFLAPCTHGASSRNQGGIILSSLWATKCDSL